MFIACSFDLYSYIHTGCNINIHIENWLCNSELFTKLHNITSMLKCISTQTAFSYQSKMHTNILYVILCKYLNIYNNKYKIAN